MSRISPTFLLTWVITSLVTMAVWFFVPGKGIDRQLLVLTAGGLVEGSMKIEGNGSHFKPWQLSSEAERPTMVEATGTIGLKDNLDGIFQDSPHAPIDMAVILNNLQRLGTRQLACSVLLAWDEPDPIGLAALENALSEFESVVLATPVTRGPIMDAMPAGLRRASLPIDRVEGDLSSLPVINRTSIPSLIHGGDNTMIGFGVIDSDPMTEKLPLMARWDDRLIFSFPMVATMQRAGISINDIQIEVGSHIQFSKQGARIPIDEFGRLDVVLNSQADTELLAEDLIDAELGSDELPDLGKALLCDFRSHADITTRDFNRAVIPGINMLLSGGGPIEAVELQFTRISSVWEMVLLLLWATAMAAVTLLNRPWVGLAGLAAFLSIAVGLWVCTRQGIWLPGIAAWAAVVVAQIFAACTGSQRKRTTSMPRLNRLEFESAGPKPADHPKQVTPAPDKPEEEQDYALAPKDAGLDSKHESD